MMTPENRARIVLALRILAWVCLVGAPVLSLIGANQDYEFVNFLGAVAVGIVSALVWFMLSIVTEAAHLYISKNTPTDDDL